MKKSANRESTLSHSKKTFLIGLLLLTTFLLFTVVCSGCNKGNNTTSEKTDSNSQNTTASDNDDFATIDIPQYISKTDTDGDVKDDQTDILESAKAYVATEPIYESKYYAGGYPDDGHGMCTDVVAQALLGAGFDLRDLLQEDVKNHPENYTISQPDYNTDFRRVPNQNVYFQNYAISLTTDPSKLEEWQGGDIVVFQRHIGIVSDRRNKDGIPYLIHHYSKRQTNYEQDALLKWGAIVGHYRMSQ